MPADTDARTSIIEISQTANPDRVRAGWTVEPLRWNDQDLSVAIDPRFQVLHVAGGPFDAAVDAARRACETPHGSDAHEAALEDLEREFTTAAAQPAPPGMGAVARAARDACDTPHGSDAHEAALEQLDLALDALDRLCPPIDRDGLRQAGWTPASTDSSGNELWVRPRSAAATQALDRLATTPPAAAPDVAIT